MSMKLYKMVFRAPQKATITQFLMSSLEAEYTLNRIAHDMETAGLNYVHAAITKVESGKAKIQHIFDMLDDKSAEIMVSIAESWGADVEAYKKQTSQTGKGTAENLTPADLKQLDPCERLRYLMEVQSLTQTELAEQLGTSRPYLSQMMSGKRAISGEYSKKLAAFFGTSTDFWLEERGGL